MGFWSRKKFSPTFCVNPWIQQTALPTGRVSFCCVAVHGGGLSDKDGNGYYAPERNFEDAWNSPKMLRIRQKMLNGEKVDDCANCYFQESIGKKSAREMLNDEWIQKIPNEVLARVEASQKTRGIVSSPALYLDLRLGNLCNLKCRMCNPFNSSKIYSETMHLRQNNAEFKDFYDSSHVWRMEPVPTWFEDERFWASVERHLPDLRKVYLTGGEPTLIKRNLKFMKNCVDSGHSKHIFLMFSSNCTYLPDEFIELLQHFEFTLINCSVDGVGPVNDYIRDGSKWETIDKNLRRLIQLGPSIKIGITPVAQIYNVLDLVPLFRYIDQINELAHQELNVDLLYANAPGYFDIRHLPTSVKSVAYTEVADYRAASKLYRSNSYMRNSIDSLLNALSAKTPEGAAEQLETFFKYTEFLDNHRGQSFRATFPRLQSLIERSREGVTLDL